HVDTAGQGQFQNLILEDPGSGTNTITLKSPTAPTTHILTLPGAPVANGQLLTDSSGLLTWAKPSLLSASHADTLAAADVRGDLMVGNSTPAWSRFAIGADTYVLTVSGSDPLWVSPATFMTGPHSFVSKSGDYTVLSTDEIVFVNCSGGPVTITLLTAVGRAGKLYTIKKTDSSTNLL